MLLIVGADVVGVTNSALVRPEAPVIVLGFEEASA